MLFDGDNRFGRRPKNYTESDFEYLNESARPAVVAFRRLASEWFARVPSHAQVDLRARFRSPNSFQHHSAFFELYLHEMLIQLGYTVEVHPPMIGINSTPDFLATRSGALRFYLEATLAGIPSGDEQAAGARAGQVYDCINTIDSPNFFLRLDVRGAPDTPPPTQRLRRDLAEWLRGLEPDKIQTMYDAAGEDEIPELHWSHDGWDITFQPIPKSPKSRGRAGVRPIGMQVPQPRWLSTHTDIKKAIESKTGKYGQLGLPFIVAINVFADHCDNIDIMNALFGEEFVSVTQKADGTLLQKPGRKPNGVWVRPQGIANEDISGALVVSFITPWTMGVLTPELFHNPWASRPITASDWTLPQCIPDLNTGSVEHRQGVSGASLFRMPMPWPLPD